MLTLSTSTLDTARSRCADRPAWLRAIERAAVLLPASTVEALDAGRLRIVSARSGAAYVASKAGCTCEAALHGRPCWHRAAARLVELEPRVLRCRYCAGAMVEGTTPGGEPCYECSGCGHTAHAGTVERGAEVA
ncbi:MAG: hypothetical protein RLZZ387_908 [Chloroflexota bacterium]|jgi:hypothetical protein